MAISRRKPTPQEAATSAAVASARAAVAAKQSAHPPEEGHNNPPSDDGLQAHRDRYADLRQAGEAWLREDISDQETADRAEAWRKQVGAARKAADTARADEKRPHDEAGRAVQKKWLPVIEAFDRLDGPIRQKLTDWAVAERARIASEREAARVAAEEARRDAERAAATALESGTFSSQDHAAELARQADEADQALKAAEREKVKIGAGSSVGGVKRSAGLRSFEVVIVTDPVAALAHLARSNNAAMDGVREAITTLFRAVRKTTPEIAAGCPGLTITTEERIV